MSVEEDLKAIEAGLDRRDAEIARLRAEVERLEAERADKLYGVDRVARLLQVHREEIAARDRVIEAAFKALDAARTWEFATGREPDLGGILDLYRDSEAEARRLRAEQEGK